MSKTITLPQVPELSGYPVEFDVFKPVVKEIIELASEMQAKVQEADYMNESDCKAVKDLRNKMVKLRTGAEKLKKEGKAHALEVSQMWDSAWNQIKAFCEKQEEKARELETRAETEQAEKARIEGERRLAEIEPYILDRDIFNMTYPDLSKIPSVAWPALLAQTKAAFEAHQAKVKAEQEAEEAREKAEQEAREKEAAKARLAIDRANQCRKYMSVASIPDAEMLVSMRDDDFNAMIADLESLLENAQKIAEKQAKEAQRRKDLHNHRYSLIAPYAGYVDAVLPQDLSECDEDLFSQVLESAKKDKEAADKAKAEQMAEMARIAAEKKAKEQAEAARLAEEKAKADAIAKEAAMADFERLNAIAERLKSFMSLKENSLSNFNGSDEAVQAAKKANGKLIEAYYVLLNK